MLCIAELYSWWSAQPLRESDQETLRPFPSDRGRRRQRKITSSTPDAELCTGFEPMTILVELILTDNFLHIYLQGGTVLKYNYNLQ